MESEAATQAQDFGRDAGRARRQALGKAGLGAYGTSRAWDGWTRVGTLENLLLSGVSLQLDEVLKTLEPTFQDLLPYGMFSDDQARWLFARYLCVMAFVDPPGPGIAKIREFVSGFKFPAYDLGTVVAALGDGRCDDAFAGPDGKGVDALGESWIEAIAALESARSSEILLSFVGQRETVQPRLPSRPSLR